MKNRFCILLQMPKRLSLALALLALAVPAPAAEVFQASALADAVEDRGLVLRRGETSSQLELADGTTVPLALGGSDVSSLAELRSNGAARWLVASSGVPADTATGLREDLELRIGDASGELSRLPVPGTAGETPRVRTSPVVLARDGSLIGLAWLQGTQPRDYEIWSAAFDGQRFEAPQRVAARGPGSQIALSGAVLSDGSWLLAWSAFDGSDDEIVARQRVEGVWQPIERLSDNDTPDIMPRLTAVGDGAVVAWNRYDGSSYRLSLRRFGDEDAVQPKWQPARDLGPPGGLRPRFAGSREAPILVYHRVSPRAWGAYELDVSGAPVRATSVDSERRDTPAVSREDGELVLRWSGEPAEAVRLGWRPVR